MDSPPDHPLSVEDAKARLRALAEETTLSGYVKRRPYTAVTLAFAAGAVLGTSPAARKVASRELLWVLLKAL